MSMESFPLKQKHYAILNYAGVPIDPYSRSNNEQVLREKLMKGLYFFDNTLKYSVSRTGKDCYALYARMLKITGSEDPLCWKWSRDHVDVNDESTPKVEVAESVNVRWLEARVRFSSVNLQQNTNYKVFFKVKAKYPELKDVLLTVKLVLPDGTKQENQKKIQTVDRWVDLPVGEFKTSYNTIGILDLSLQQLDQNWKKGLFIKSMEIIAVD